jgi:hypothetical protein
MDRMENIKLTILPRQVKELKLIGRCKACSPDCSPGTNSPDSRALRARHAHAPPVAPYGDQLSNTVLWDSVKSSAGSDW